VSGRTLINDGLFLYVERGTEGTDDRNGFCE